VNKHTHRTGIFRRELLQVGLLGALGMTLPSAFAAAPAQQPKRRDPKAKSVILVWMPGGPPQMHLWDLKPDSPSQCRVTAQPIPTSVPGMRLGHQMPQIAKVGAP
jgi:hypothetical protein